MKTPPESSGAQLPPDVTFDTELNLLVWRPSGVLNEGAVNQVITFVGKKETEPGAVYLRFSDLSGLDSVELNFKYVFHVALYRRLTYANRPNVKSAFLVTDADALHYVKLHGVLTDHSALTVKHFEDYDDAAKWLEVPVQSIRPPAAG